MADARETVTLTTGGHHHYGWESVQISLSVERLSGSFTLSLSDAWIEQGRLVRRTVQPGESCAIAIGAETVITGYVDSVEPSFGDKSHPIAVTGRDRTGDLVDCSADSKEWLDQGAAAIATALCAPFGVPVRVSGDLGKPFERFAVNAGDGVSEAIERLCRHRGLIAYSDGLGGLVLAKSVGGGGAAVLKRGVNLLKASAKNDHSGRHSEVTVKATREGTEGLSAEDIAGIQSTAKDGAIGRHRPLVLVAGMQADGPSAQDRANYEQQVRTARSQTIQASVQGWHGLHGLWRPGQMVTVNDDWLGVAGAWLISSLNFGMSNSGALTDMTLVPPGAFDRLAEPDKGGW